MKGGRQPHGFTIVETMIFIAVSGVLFLGALQLISGKEAKTEFTTSINQIRADLQSTLGNVANGYYHTQSNYACTESPGGPNINSGMGVTSKLGSNTGCIFLGEVIQFGVAGGSGQVYNSYPVAGLQYYYKVGTGFTQDLTATLDDAKPTLIDISGTPYSNATPLQYGITLDTAKGVCYQNGASCNTINSNSFGLFAFNGCTGTAAGTHQLNSGTQCIIIAPLPNPLFSGAALKLTDHCGLSQGVVCDPSFPGTTYPQDPSGGIQICLDSGGTKESALFTIGGTNNPTGVDMQRFSQRGCQ